MIPGRVVLATANPGKVRELTRLVRRWGDVDLVGLDRFLGVSLPPEDGQTYADNATGKATAVAGATGLPALGDDSGLEVDALAGAPGLWSARFAPTDAARVEKLLHALAGVAPPARTARFRCVVAMAWPEGRVILAEGVCEGRIATVVRGEGGFGYDPVFEPEGFTTSFAALPAETKDRVSHRARALEALGRSLLALK